MVFASKSFLESVSTVIVSFGFSSSSTAYFRSILSSVVGLSLGSLSSSLLEVSASFRINLTMLSICVKVCSTCSGRCDIDMTCRFNCDCKLYLLFITSKNWNLIFKVNYNNSNTKNISQY